MALTCASQSNYITVHAAAVENPIPGTLYGSCMEDVNHEVYGGFYAQEIMGESFEEPASGVDYNYWKKAGGYWAQDREYGDEAVTIIPGRHTKRMIAGNELQTEPDETAKLMYTASQPKDGIVEADVRFLQARGDGAGMIIRASQVGIGEDDCIAYEVRLSRAESVLRLIRHRNNTELLEEKPVRFDADAWNHLRIVFDDSRIRVYLNDTTVALLEYTAAPVAGMIGLCTAGTPTAFRNISLSAHVLPLVYPPAHLVSDRWDIVEAGGAKAVFSLEQRDAFNGLAAQSVALLSPTGRAGIANRGLDRWGIAVGKNERFTGACFLKNEGGDLPVTVALESKDGKIVYATQTINCFDTAWRKYPFTLTTNTDDTCARFALYIDHPGKFRVDQVSLFQTGEHEYHGLPLRADICQALSAEGLTFMRYAGSMVNAPGYRFKKMIGDRDLRPPYTGHWNEYSTNGFGIEEFLQFCEASGITPLFAVNIEETPEDVSDMVEYLNGDVHTRWGQKRAENGHPTPYKVRYIEIGNEEVLFEGDDPQTYEHYLKRFCLLYDAMHTKDSTIAFIASPWWRPGSPNMEKVFRALDGKAAYWDYHVGADDKDAGPIVDQELTRMQQLFRHWNPDTRMKCAILEENGSLHDMQRALGHATILNAVRKHGDFVLTTVQANALQPYLQNDNGWDQGQIFFTPSRVWGMPPYYAEQMAALNHLPLRVRTDVRGKLNVTATRSEDGKTLVLHVVNTDTLPQDCVITLRDFPGHPDHVKTYTLAGALNDVNAEGVPAEVAVGDTGDIHYEFQPLSYTILRFEDSKAAPKMERPN